MKNRRAILAIWLVLAAPAVADLNKPKQIDRVHIHPQTKQAALSLVTNEALDAPASPSKLAEKLNTYISYVDSRKLYADYPEVDPKLPVVISLTVMVPPGSDRAKEFLIDTRTELEKRRFEVWLHIYDPASKKLKRE